MDEIEKFSHNLYIFSVFFSFFFSRQPPFFSVQPKSEEKQDQDEKMLENNRFFLCVEINANNRLFISVYRNLRETEINAEPKCDNHRLRCVDGFALSLKRQRISLIDPKSTFREPFYDI